MSPPVPSHGGFGSLSFGSRPAAWGIIYNRRIIFSRRPDNRRSRSLLCSLSPCLFSLSLCVCLCACPSSLFFPSLFIVLHLLSDRMLSLPICRHWSGQKREAGEHLVAASFPPLLSFLLKKCCTAHRTTPTHKQFFSVCFCLWVLLLYSWNLCALWPSPLPPLPPPPSSLLL